MTECVSNGVALKADSFGPAGTGPGSRRSEGTIGPSSDGFEIAMTVIMPVGRGGALTRSCTKSLDRGCSSCILLRAPLDALIEANTMTQKRLISFGFLLFLMAAPVTAQDISQGTVLAYDRKANILVLTDRSVFPLEKLEGEMPAGLASGDRVELQYDSNEDDGITKIFSIKVVPK